MCTLYDRIQDLCKSKGVSASRMCLELGMSKSTMSDLKGGRKKGLNAETAQKIAAYFGVSVGYLLGEEDKKEKPVENDGLSESQQAIMNVVKSLPDDKAQKLFRLMQAYLEDE